MTQNAMKRMTLAPMLFLFNGYWMLSNKQIFENKVNLINYTTDQMSSSHHLNTMFELDQGTPLLIICFAFIFIVIMRIFFYEALVKYGYVLSVTEIKVDEDLPNFFEALKKSDINWYLEESKYYRETYNYDFTTKMVREKLEVDLPAPKKPL